MYHFSIIPSMLVNRSKLALKHSTASICLFFKVPIPTSLTQRAVQFLFLDDSDILWSVLKKKIPQTECRSVKIQEKNEQVSQSRHYQLWRSGQFWDQFNFFLFNLLTRGHISYSITCCVIKALKTCLPLRPTDHGTLHFLTTSFISRHGFYPVKLWPTWGNQAESGKIYIACGLKAFKELNFASNMRNLLPLIVK